MTYQYPKFETTSRGLFNQITTIENRLLQKLIDLGGTLFLEGEFTLMAYSSMVMFKVIDDNTILIECISTPTNLRRQGSGRQTMEAIVHAAKETNTHIELFACNVTGGGWMFMPQMVIAHGIQKTNKIPVAKLKGWYETFGFEVIQHDKKRKGYEMKFNPTK